MLRNTRSKLAMATDPPRAVRRKPGRSEWLARVFTLPHTLIGVGLVLFLLAEASCALLGRDAPARAVVGAGPSRKYVDRHTIRVAYVHSGRVHWAEGTVTAGDYDALTSAAAAQPAPQPRGLTPDAPPVRVHYLAAGPWHYAKVLLRDERPFDGNSGLLIAVPFWDGVIALLVYQLYVRPYRQRQLYRFGIVSPGRITGVRRVEGKGGHYVLSYAFVMDDGTPVTARMRVPLYVIRKFAAGDLVRVLHYPGRARPSVIYEHGDYTADGIAAMPKDAPLPLVEIDPNRAGI